MSINRFPWQDDILRILGSGEASSVDAISEAIGHEGRDPGEAGANSTELRGSVAENVDHLVHIGLAEYTDGGVKLTDRGREAVASLP
jgi:hypothetical protein